MKKTAGRKADDGATGLRRVGVGLDAETIRIMRDFGGKEKNLSLGIREAGRILNAMAESGYDFAGVTTKEAGNGQ